MKNRFLSLAGLCLLGSVALAQDLGYSANHLRGTVDYLYQVSLRVGDRGPAANDLYNLRNSAERFAAVQGWGEYEMLRRDFDMAQRSWIYLRSFQYERMRFGDVENDMGYIRSIMETPRPRVVPVFGNGSGGTTHGDRNGACGKAAERALDAVAQQCLGMRGNLLNSVAGSCACHRKAGSKDDYNCGVQARGSCEVYGRF